MTQPTTSPLYLFPILLPKPLNTPSGSALSPETHFHPEATVTLQTSPLPPCILEGTHTLAKLAFMVASTWPDVPSLNHFSLHSFWMPCHLLSCASLFINYIFQGGSCPLPLFKMQILLLLISLHSTNHLQQPNLVCMGGAGLGQGSAMLSQAALDPPPPHFLPGLKAYTTTHTFWVLPTLHHPL